MATVDICLITSSPLASNPRVVKEAEALIGEGYRVQIIAREPGKTVRPIEETIRHQVRLSCVYVNKSNPLIAKIKGGVSKVARRLYGYGVDGGISLAIWAHHPLSMALFRAAARYPARLYIAHNLAALPAAIMAAERYRARVGFDAEDFHSGELAPTNNNRLELELRRRLEGYYLPRCNYVTAASPGIGDAYKKAYGVQAVTVLNAMNPFDDPNTTSDDWAKERFRDGFSLYWFSQTISLDRGLQTAIEALSLTLAPTRLYIRGTATTGAKETLLRMAAMRGVVDRVHFLAPAPPGKMVSLAACHDVGLSLEQSSPPNRTLCLTNKVFTYLAGGIPQLMTATQAQKEFGEKLGIATLLVEQDQPHSWAKRLDELLLTPGKLADAKLHAKLLAREQYNWDIERYHFLSEIKWVLKD